MDERVTYQYEAPLRIIPTKSIDVMRLTPVLDPGRSTPKALGYNDLPISMQLQCGVVTHVALAELPAKERERVLRKIAGWDYSPLTRVFYSLDTAQRVRRKQDAAATFLARRHERTRANRPSRSKKR